MTCSECGSDEWAAEMGGSTVLRHYRGCSHWDNYFDGGEAPWPPRTYFGANSAEIAAYSNPQVEADIAEMMAPFLGEGDIVIEWGNESHSWGADGSASHRYSHGRTVIRGKGRKK